MIHPTKCDRLNSISQLLCLDLSLLPIGTLARVFFSTSCLPKLLFVLLAQILTTPRVDTKLGSSFWYIDGLHVNQCTRKIMALTKDKAPKPFILFRIHLYFGDQILNQAYRQ